MTAYFSSCPTGVNREGEVCKAVVTAHWLAGLVLQSQPTWVKSGNRLYFNSHCGHSSIGVTCWEKMVKGWNNLIVPSNNSVLQKPKTAALLVVVKGKLQARERSTRFQLAMELYSSTSTLAVIQSEVNRYGKVKKKKKNNCKPCANLYKSVKNLASPQTLRPLHCRARQGWSGCCSPCNCILVSPPTKAAAVQPWFQNCCPGCRISRRCRNYCSRRWRQW